MGREEKLVEAGEDISAPEDLLIQAERYIELFPKISEFFEKYGKAYANLVKQRKNLLNMLEGEQKKTDDLEKKLGKSSAEAETIGLELAQSRKEAAEYKNLIAVYERTLGSVVEGLATRINNIGETYAKIMECMFRLATDNEALGGINKDLGNIIKGLRERLQDYESLEEITIEPTEAVSGEGKAPFSDGQTPDIDAEGLPADHINPIKTAEAALGVEKEPQSKAPQPKYDIMKREEFTIQDAFNYVMMVVYDHIDPDKKKADKGGFAEHITQQISHFVENWTIEDNDIKRAVDSTGAGREVIIRYFKDVKNYIESQKEKKKPQTGNMLDGIILDCCTAIIDMKKEGTLKDKLPILDIRLREYVEMHNEKLYAR
jgi:hypothetical protein